VREAAFGVRRVDGGRQRVDHLTEAAFTPRLFRSLALGDVFDGQQDPLALSLGVVDAPGVDQHGAAAQLLEVVLDLELVDAGALCQDFPEQLAQARDVPLVIAELVEYAPFCLGGSDLEGLVEGTVGGLDPQVTIQDEKRLPDRLDDAFGEDPGFVFVWRGGVLVGHRLGASLSSMLPPTTKLRGTKVPRLPARYPPT
jgi:hypothetical protein